jgi:molybdopterin molybdotransferase
MLTTIPGYTARMLTVREASARIRAATAPLPAEIVAIDRALGRFLAQDVVAGRVLPPWDNSAMDGFAVRSRDVPGVLPVAGTIAAGHSPGAVLAPGTALRIMTGAPLPAGADAVVIREDVDDRGDSAAIAVSARPGENIRRAGEDVTLGSAVLSAGARLGAGEIGLLAALGNAVITVGRRPRVAIMSTGDELVGVDVTPGPGQIVNSNAHALAAQVRQAGGVPIHAGIAPDEPGLLVAMLKKGLQADVLLTSGGVSVGDFDHVKDAFMDAGVSMDFWKVAMKPGKPLAFGVTDAGTPVFGLPGNPVSSMVVFELFARPALLAMQGAGAVDRPRVDVVLDLPYRKPPGRAHYVRARLERRGDTLHAAPLARQGSGMLSSMVGVHALLELDKDTGDVAPGQRVPALLLENI